MNLLSEPAVIGLIVGLPTFVLGFLAYRRTEKLDEEAAKVVVITAQGDAAQRLLDNMDRMLANLQIDNRIGRELAADLARQLKECREAYDRLRSITHTQYVEDKSLGEIE